MSSKSVGRPLLLAIPALAISYALCLLLQINHFIRTLLGQRYLGYQLLFYILFAVLFLASIARIRPWSHPVLSAVTGTLIGFLASSLAFLLQPALGNSLTSIFVYGRASFSNLLFSASGALGWITGLIFGVTLHLLLKTTMRGRGVME